MIKTHHGINSMSRSLVPTEYELLNYIKYNGGAAFLNEAEFWLPLTLSTTQDVEFFMTVRLNEAEYDNKPIFRSHSNYGATGIELIHVEVRREYGQSYFRLLKNGGTAKNFKYYNLSYCINKHTFLLKNGELFDVDSDTRIISDASIFSPVSINSTFSPSVNIDGTGGGIEMYEYKIVLDGTVLYDYVPVKEKSTDYLGFYDLVNKTFTTLISKQYLQYYSAG